LVAAVLTLGSFGQLSSDLAKGWQDAHRLGVTWHAPDDDVFVLVQSDDGQERQQEFSRFEELGVRPGTNLVDGLLGLDLALDEANY
jgi:hypothetical protein